jgi:iron complex transport system ATP-binding protein
VGFSDQNKIGGMSESHKQPLILDDLSAGYKGRPPVLAHVNHQFPSKGLHVIIGRNGAGKSTLIRTLAGLQAPLSGSVQLNATSLHDLPANERAQRVAFVSSVPPRTSELRVHEVLALASGDEERNRSMLQAAGDPSWWKRRLQELSDGEAQRVMFIRALLQGTDWILLDEPTAFLDVPARLALWRELTAAASKGVGVLVATHDYGEIQGHAEIDSIAMVGNHRLRPLSVRASASEWTAALMGEL